MFASYNAAQFAGPIAIVSWLVGAVIALVIALLLAEIATLYSAETGLFARLLTLTHNRDIGFILSSSNWLASVVTIPSEAEASMQYLAYVFPKVQPHIFTNNHFTVLGNLFVCVLIFVYALLNYWGIKLLTRSNNIITVLKFTVPALSAVVILTTSFHSTNFTAYHNTIAPYGYHKIFSTIVNCGIFYSFYGFSLITVFARELKDPQHNIPLALGSSVIICLVIYVLLQIAFIGALDPHMIAKGWHSLNFTSPLAQLATLLGINWLSLILYVDATISPSGTGIIYVGSCARMLTGMAEDKQLPRVFAKEHSIYKVSRLSLIITIITCILFTWYFNNWTEIMLVCSVFKLISCMAVSVAFCRLRKDFPDKHRAFKMPFGRTISYLGFIIISYLLVQCGIIPTLLSLFCCFAFFLIYIAAYYQSFNALITSFASSWSFFLYLVVVLIFVVAKHFNLLNNIPVTVLFIISMSIMYYFLVNQKFYDNCRSTAVFSTQ